MSRGIGHAQRAILATIEAAGATGVLAAELTGDRRNVRRALVALVQRGHARVRMAADGPRYVTHAYTVEHLSEEPSVADHCKQRPDADNGPRMITIPLRVTPELAAKADEVVEIVARHGIRPSRAAVMRAALTRGLADLARGGAAPSEPPPHAAEAH